MVASASRVMNLVDNISTYLKAQSNTHHVSELMLWMMLREKCEQRIQQLQNIE